MWHKFSIVFLTLLCLCGCEKNKQDKDSKVLKINLQSDIASLHPHVGVDLQCRCILRALYEGLTRINAQGVPELAAAEKIDISEDQCRYTFTIRPHKWSNGQPVTAKHFADAWKKAISKGSNCSRAELFYIIKNAKKVKKGELPLEEVGIHVKDDKTLVVDLEHPATFFLDLLSNAIYNPIYNIDEEVPSVFSGPFILELWKHNKHISFKANPQYWDRANVKIDKIVASFVKDPNTALLMFEKGEIDWIGWPFTLLPLDAIPNLEKTEHVHSKEISAVYWFCLNTKTPLLSSSKVRKALSYAINRGQIAQYVLHGENPNRSMMPYHLQILEEKDLYSDGDIITAQKLFDEGLKELNLSKDDLPPLIFSHSDVTGQKTLSEAIAQEWEKTFGIKVELSGSEWNVFSSNLARRQYQIGGCTWYFLYNDPSYALDCFKELSNRHNSPQWENKEYQKLLEAAEKETKKELRIAYLKKAEKILLDEMPIIPIYSLKLKYLMNKNLKGIYISSMGQVEFKGAYFE